MKTISILTIALAFACGAPIESDDLGQVEQAYTIQQSTSGASRLWSGWRPLSAGLACRSDQATTVDCALPASKTIVYQVKNGSSDLGNGPCTASALAAFGADVDSFIPTINSALSVDGWAVSRNDGAPIGTATMQLVCDGASTQTGLVLSDYVTHSLLANTAMTETLPGNWLKVSQSLATIKVKALNDLGTSGASDVKLRRHVVGNAMVKALGVGSSDAVANVVSVGTLAQDDPNQGLLTSGQLCRTKNLVNSGLALGVSSTASCANN